MGTFGYDGNAKGATAWKRMVPLGLQWGNSPKVAYADTCSGPNGPSCNRKKLTEQWINEQAYKDLNRPPLSFNHLGYAGRLAGPVDNPKASCMGCHQTAGFPGVAILPEFSANGSLLKLDAVRQPQTEQSLRMMYYGNVASGVVFSDNSALLLRLFAPAFDEPAELHLASLRAEGSRRKCAAALNLRAARSMGGGTAKGDPRSHDVRRAGTR
jgi:hypothetical protein